jgi:hypothetical protein
MVRVRGRDFLVYLNKSPEKCFRKDSIESHIKIVEVEKSHEISPSKDSLLKKLVSNVVKFHLDEDRVSPWIFFDEILIGLTKYQIKIFVDSCYITTGSCSRSM